MTLADALSSGQPLRVHVVAIGGAGMSAIATVLAELGHRVSGTDAADSPVLDRLRAQGIEASVGHDAAKLPADVDLVTVSTAVSEHNPEVVAALERGVPVLRRADMLAGLCGRYRTVAVAGTHGKTTTSSLLAEILMHAELDPGFVIGAKVASLGVAARAGNGDLFVVEADESDGSAFTLPRAAVIVTNVEPDHLEHHGDFQRLVDRFVAFVAETDGPVVVCADDPVARSLVEGQAVDAAAVRTYGQAADADVRIVNVTHEPFAVSWELEGLAAGPLAVRLALPGVHNALNATAAIVQASLLGVDPEVAIDALRSHQGVARRFEFRGAARGVTFVDDYAHLPSEVAAAIAAGADGSWGRVVAVFQPHRYSRTEALGATFGDSFRRADVVVLTDIYSAGEAPRSGVDGTIVVNAVRGADPDATVIYCPTLDDVTDFLVDQLRDGDLCLTLGAGDLTSVPDRVLAGWEH